MQVIHFFFLFTLSWKRYKTTFDGKGDDATCFFPTSSLQSYYKNNQSFLMLWRIGHAKRRKVYEGSRFECLYIYTCIVVKGFPLDLNPLSLIQCSTRLRSPRLRYVWQLCVNLHLAILQTVFIHCASKRVTKKVLNELYVYYTCIDHVLGQLRW